MSWATIGCRSIKFEVLALTSRARCLNVRPTHPAALTGGVDLLLIHANVRIASCLKLPNKTLCVCVLRRTQANWTISA